MGILTAIDVSFVIMLIAALMKFLRFAAPKRLIAWFQSASETAVLWLDYQKPIRWYAALKNRSLLYLLSLAAFLVSAGQFSSVLLRAVVAIPVEVSPLIIVTIVISIFLGRHAIRLGRIQLALLAGKRDEFYKLNPTLRRFLANCIRAIAGIGIPTAAVFIFSFLALWFGPRLVVKNALDERVTVALTIIVSFVFLWELTTTVIVVFALLLAMSVFATLHMVLRVICWISYMIAEHPSGAFAGVFYLIMAILAIAGLVVRFLSEMKSQ